jgi:hypothetical protein
MIPQSFDGWYRCITVDCGISLSASYIAERIRVLSDSRHPETRKFVARYGEAHTQRILSWFQQVQKGLI